MSIPFATKFPRSNALGLKPVLKGTHEGFDSDDVAAKLGSTRYAALMVKIVASSSVFCCGHRTWPQNHATVGMRGAEVYCIFASDLEAFLQAGG